GPTTAMSPRSRLGAIEEERTGTLRHRSVLDPNVNQAPATRTATARATNPPPSAPDRAARTGLRPVRRERLSATRQAATATAAMATAAGPNTSYSATGGQPGGRPDTFETYRAVLRRPSAPVVAAMDAPAASRTAPTTSMGFGSKPVLGISGSGGAGSVGSS